MMLSEQILKARGICEKRKKYIYTYIYVNINTYVPPKSHIFVNGFGMTLIV